MLVDDPDTQVSCRGLLWGGLVGVQSQAQPLSMHRPGECAFCLHRPC